MNIKEWLRISIKPYLNVIKKAISDAQSKATSDAVTTANAYTDTAKQEILSKVTSITGVFKGSYDTLADIPEDANQGDWIVINTDILGSSTDVKTPQFESGIYVKSETEWVFVSDLQTFQEIKSELFISDEDLGVGVESTDKTMTVKQINEKINNAIIYSFTGEVTNAEALDDWNAVNPTAQAIDPNYSQIVAYDTGISNAVRVVFNYVGAESIYMQKMLVMSNGTQVAIATIQPYMPESAFPVPPAAGNYNFEFTFNIGAATSMAGEFVSFEVNNVPVFTAIVAPLA